MKIEKGIQSNCSETVIRLFAIDYAALPADILSSVWAFDEPTDGYSSMRPTPGTRCVYFYQSAGHELQQWLEEKKIPYDIEAPFQEQHPDWEKLDPTPEEQELKESCDGGSGEFYRRKPYAN